MASEPPGHLSAEQKKIKEQLNFQDSWSTKVDKQEYEEVAGFVKFVEGR